MTTIIHSFLAILTILTNHPYGDMTIEVCHLDDLQSGELGPISIGVRDYAVDGHESSADGGLMIHYVVP